MTKGHGKGRDPGGQVGGGPPGERVREPEENVEDLEERSEIEREADRDALPIRLGDDHVTDLVAEVDDLEGHDLLGAAARERLDEDAGPDADLRPSGMSEVELDRARRRAKDAYRPAGPAGRSRRESKGAE